MADGRHFENRYLAIYPRHIVRLTQNLEGSSRITCIRISWPKWQISKTKDGGRPPFWEWPVLCSQICPFALHYLQDALLSETRC